MEDVIQICPKCQSSNVSIKDLKFLKCYDLMFQRNEENCPKCDERLQRSNFRARMFESDEVESYMSYYQLVKRTYNCDASDFERLEDYNDYLEDVETLIHDLMSKDKNEEARNRMIEYKNAHKINIKDKDIEIYEQLEKEKDERRIQVDDDMRKEKEKREQLDDELAKRLLASDEPLSDVMRKYSQIVEEKSRQVAARGDARPTRHVDKIYRYDTPLYMSRPTFHYEMPDGGIHTDVLLQSLKKPVDGLIRGGGYTPDFWLYRLRYFCE